MIVLNPEDLSKRYKGVATAARQQERERIVGVMQDYADAALGAGELEIAERITQIIGNVSPQLEGEGEFESVEALITSEQNQDKREFDAELFGDLPRVQFNSDEDDAARLLRAHPRMQPPDFSGGVPRD